MLRAFASGNRGYRKSFARPASSTGRIFRRHGLARALAPLLCQPPVEILVVVTNRRAYLDEGRPASDLTPSLQSAPGSRLIVTAETPPGCDLVQQHDESPPSQEMRTKAGDDMPLRTMSLTVLRGFEWQFRQWAAHWCQTSRH
jgi:hypothetical protein